MAARSGSGTFGMDRFDGTALSSLHQITESTQYTANTVSGVVGVVTVACTGLTFLGVAVVLCGISGAGQCRAVGAVKEKKYA